jgi:L-serine dehydratase
MKAVSIFNHVLGPVMRGPSSSHTAAAFHIGKMARSLAGGEPSKAVCTFDPDGAYANTYAQQGADLAFAVGLMGWDIIDERFFDALSIARERGLEIQFVVGKLPGADHPNTVDMQLRSTDSQQLRLRANSIGGGAVEITRVQNWPVRLTGDSYEILLELSSESDAAAIELLSRDADLRGEPECESRDGVSLVCVRRTAALPATIRESVTALPGFHSLRTAEPVFLVPKGEPLASSAAEFVSLSRRRNVSLGGAALEYEAALLGLSHDEVLEEMSRRFEIMRDAVRLGLQERPPPMQLLSPSAGKIYAAEADGRTAIGGMHTRAAARAMAVMHVNSGMGVVCAAPTGGAAGTLPAVVVTLAEERGLDTQSAALALLAAGAVGVAVASRATFAAEVAGCQVEIGAAGAMAAAAVVEAAGGSAQQAADAAAIAFQNTMGSVCDLVQGIVEIPCHTRNAVAASNAFVCADLILGGYDNPIPLDETIDAVHAVGKMLPPELRCTALGGLATAPSAIALQRLR